MMDTPYNDEEIHQNTTPVANNTPIPTKVQGHIIKQEEKEMAEVDTYLLAGQHADIRREAAEHSADIRRESAERIGEVRYDVSMGVNESVKESIKGDWHNSDVTKDARYDIATRIEGATDRVTDQSTAYFIAATQSANEAARDLASLKVLTDANAFRISSELQLGIEKAAAATALESQKVATAVALGQSILSKEIFADGQKTRDLMNDLKYHDMNRALIERNTELVEEREGRRHWRHAADQNQFQGQWAQLQSQIQAFQSQLQETRQGMVNFGTMAGVGQSSTSNNVR